MTISGLTLYYHPFSSFCQKALMALYENEVPFERRIIDLGDTEQRAELARLWPMTKFPVLRDNQAEVLIVARVGGRPGTRLRSMAARLR